MRALGCRVLHVADAGAFTWGRGAVPQGSQPCPSACSLGQRRSLTRSSSPPLPLTDCPQQVPPVAAPLCTVPRDAGGRMGRLQSHGTPASSDRAPGALPSPPGDVSARQSPCWSGRPDNGPFEGHRPIWGGKSLSITDSMMGPALQSALTYKQPPHMGSGLQPCSEPKINREASKHPNSAAGLRA